MMYVCELSILSLHCLVCLVEVSAGKREFHFMNTQMNVCTCATQTSNMMNHVSCTLVSQLSGTEDDAGDGRQIKQSPARSTGQGCIGLMPLNRSFTYQLKDTLQPTRQSSD